MKIEGVIRVEGVELHVDVEAPDGATHVYVTNVAPNTLVIPPERLPLRSLALTDGTADALAARGAHTLADLLDRRGDLKVTDLPPERQEDVQRVIAELKTASLVFDWKLKPVAARAIPISGVIPETIAGAPAMGRARSPAHDAPEVVLDHHIGEIEVLSPRHRDELLRKGITTLRDLAALGEDGLLMVKHFDVRKIEQVKTWLAAKGVSLDGKPLAPDDAAAERVTTPTRAFLLSQGVTPAMPEDKL